MPKLKLNCQDLSNKVRSVMETRQDNDMIDYTDAIYAQNEIELLGPI